MPSNYSHISISYPLDMLKHTITQDFGSNPETYKRFIVGGRPLKGHNGTDFGPLDGQSHEVWPVDSGTVSYVGFDPMGYGWYVDIQHIWGKSRYAHLSKLYVKANDRVQAPRAGQPGQALGMTGSTGFSTATHLHLAIYPNAESKSNGYGGAVDPMQPPPNGLFTAGSYTEPVTPTTPTSSDISAGLVRVTAMNGLKLRKAPNTIDQHFAVLPYGTQIEVTNETKAVDGVLFRKAEVWIAEKQGSQRYVEQVSKNYTKGR